MVGTTLLIRECEMFTNVFEALINAAITCPITLDLGWISIKNFKSFTINIKENNQLMESLKITYSDLGDEGKLI